MDELRKYATYALKGLASVPLILTAAQAAARYDEVVADPERFTNPERFAEVNAAADQALAPMALFRALWSKTA